MPKPIHVISDGKLKKVSADDVGGLRPGEEIRVGIDSEPMEPWDKEQMHRLSFYVAGKTQGDAVKKLLRWFND